MKLPTAAERRKKDFEAKQKRDESLKKIAKRFVEGKLLQAMNETDGESVNEEVPQEAYRHLGDFTKYCQDILVPLGYHVELSHDGGGMYNTIYVSWKE